MNDVLLHHVMRLFSFDLTKRNTFNDRRIVERPNVISKFNLRHYSVVNDLSPVFKIPYKCISNTRGRSQTETSTDSIDVPCAFAIKPCKCVWIILSEVHCCTRAKYRIFYKKSQCWFRQGSRVGSSEKRQIMSDKSFTFIRHYSSNF